MQTFFQRPDRLEYPVDVLTVIFNNARYRTRWKHYQDFITMAERAGQAVRLWTVEIAFGDRDFAVTQQGNPRHLQLRTSHELWHKERALNLLAARVVTQHPDAMYLAFVDADITFIRHDWADETRHQLQHFNVVQMFREAYDLDEDGHVFQEHRGFGSCYQDGKPINQLDAGQSYYYHLATSKRVYWHPGYAWAWRRESYDAVGGLVDHPILGSADFHMAHGLVGNMDATIKRHLTPSYVGKLKKWESLAEKHVKRNVGFVPGSIFHHYHGAKIARQYQSRWKILESTNFDPDLDLTVDAQGLYKLEHHGDVRSHSLRDKVRGYFHSRNEDK